MDIKDKSAKRFLEITSELSETIGDLVTNRGMTPTELAGLMSVTVPSVRKYTSLCHNYTLEEITRLEAILDAELITPSQVKPTVKGSEVGPGPLRVPTPSDVAQILEAMKANSDKIKEDTHRKCLVHITEHLERGITKNIPLMLGVDTVRLSAELKEYGWYANVLQSRGINMWGSCFYIDLSAFPY